MSERKLTPKQSMFVKEYLCDLNATQAAIRAGYSEKTAYSIGQENLNKPEIAKFIDEAMAERAERLNITADSVLQEIAKLGFANIKNLYDENGKLIPIHQLPDDVAATISSIETDTVGNDDSLVIKKKYKTVDKKGCLELLGRHLKLFTDKIDHTGEIKVVRITSNVK